MKEDLCREVYKEMCEEGYITREDFKKKFDGRLMSTVHDTFDRLGLYTYDDSVRILRSKVSMDSERKKKWKWVPCIRPCKPEWDKSIVRRTE